jgi:hypothetical protein
MNMNLAEIARALFSEEAHNAPVYLTMTSVRGSGELFVCLLHLFVQGIMLRRGLGGGGTVPISLVTESEISDVNCCLMRAGVRAVAVPAAVCTRPHVFAIDRIARMSGFVEEPLGDLAVTFPVGGQEYALGFEVFHSPTAFASRT